MSPVFYNMRLCGPNGDMLPLLSKIVCLVSMPAGLRGFEFHYDNGETVVLGPQVERDVLHGTCVEQYFMVNGKGGERVLDLSTLKDERHVSLRLGVSTSQENSTMSPRPILL